MLSVVVADSTIERSQGLQDLGELPDGVDGMLFVFAEPTSTTFHMRNVQFPLDVWFFDSEGSLLGSARMETCLEGDCPSYGAPGLISWALETPADVYDFGPGSELSLQE